MPTQRTTRFWRENTIDCVQGPGLQSCGKEGTSKTLQQHVCAGQVFREGIRAHLQLVGSGLVCERLLSGIARSSSHQRHRVDVQRNSKGCTDGMGEGGTKTRHEDNWQCTQVHGEMSWVQFCDPLSSLCFLLVPLARLEQLAGRTLVYASTTTHHTTE